MKHRRLPLTVAIVVIVTGCMRPDASPRETQQPSSQVELHDRHFEEYVAAMSPKRRAWQKPEEVIAVLQFKEGDQVADLGCGTGYFTLRLAKVVGSTGRVWAVDIKQKALDKVREHAENVDLDNIEYVLTAPDDPSLPTKQIDTIFIVDVYHHLSDRVSYVKELRRALVPGGRIVIIDFIPKDKEKRGFGPPLKMQVECEAVDAEMMEAGFRLKKSHTFLPEQYFVEYCVREGN